MKRQIWLWSLSISMVFLLVGSNAVLLADSKNNQEGLILRNEPITFSLATAPSKVITTQTTYSIEITGKEAYGYESQLKSEIQAMVQNEKKGIRLVEKDALLRIYVSINAADYEVEGKENKISKIGSILTGWGKSSQDLTFRGNGLARAEDWTSGTAVQIYKETLDWDFNKNFDQQIQTPFTGAIGNKKSPPSREKMKEVYIHYVIGKIQRGLARGNVKYKVYLGDLKTHELAGGIALARAGNWQEAFDKWNSLPRFTSVKAESYRSYNLGVACEALGLKLIEIEDFQAAEPKLAQALTYYTDARTKNPAEPYFQEGASASGFLMERISRSQKECTGWREYKVTKAAMDEAEAAALAATAAKVEPPLEKQLSGDGVLRNQDVLVMVKRKLSADFIRNAIVQAERTQFDLSLQEQFKLIDGGVSEAIVEVMKSNNNKPKPAPPPPAPPKPINRRRRG